MLKAAFFMAKITGFVHDFPKGGFLCHVTMLTTSFIRAPQPAWRMIGSFTSLCVQWASMGHGEPNDYDFYSDYHQWKITI